jgi:hypothetical protein
MILIIIVLIILLIGAIMIACDLDNDLQRLQSQPQQYDYVDELLRRARRRIDEITRAHDNGNRADDM